MSRRAVRPGSRSGAPPSHPLIEPLTARETEVLELVAAGLSNEAIADSLCLSVNTIKTHLKNVYGKLEVASRTQAIARAADLGILDPAAAGSDGVRASLVA